jgi:hypothetical protein
VAGASAWPAKSIAAARAASASGDTGALGTGGVAAAGSAGGCGAVIIGLAVNFLGCAVV